MDEEPAETPAPQEPSEGEPEEQVNHLLVVGLRIALVALVIILGIVLVGNIVVSWLDLNDAPTSPSVGGPVPVSPIIQNTPSASPTASSSSSTSSDFPTLNAPPAPTDIPTVSSVPPGLVMQITPGVVSSGQSFNVSGTYQGRDGVQLQLQRLENGVWADYPNNITVTMGTYSTIAASTMTGTNSFRVYDQSAGRASNVVSVLVQ